MIALGKREERNQGTARNRPGKCTTPLNLTPLGSHSRGRYWKMTYHSEVVGSLLRPDYLVEARKQFEAGQLSAADLKAVEDRAVQEAIGLQEPAGIDVITDGELRRYALYGHLIAALEGFDKYG